MIEKNLFLLDSEIIYLNHGSFGACPVPVFESYQRWQRELERQPVAFITSVLNNALMESRARLGKYIGADPQDVLFVPNATHGVNLVARSLQLRPGDEILTTNQEYGACGNAWDYVCRRSGAVLVEQPVPMPASSEEAWMDEFWQGVTERTRVVFLSHITSSTAQRFPVAAVARRAREAGILVFVDGAHAPGQIPLDLAALDVDFYTGNCHKWMMAPKGAGFLHVRRELQAQMDPLVVSWGWSRAPEFETGSPFLDLHQWAGTDDLSSYLAVADAIDFMERHGWDHVRESCSRILAYALDGLREVTGLPDCIAPYDRGQLQMGIAELPRLREPVTFKRELLRDYGIEIPVVEWDGRNFLRVSIQGYNTRADADALIDAVVALLPQHTTTHMFKQPQG